MKALFVLVSILLISPILQSFELQSLNEVPYGYTEFEKSNEEFDSRMEVFYELKDKFETAEMVKFEDVERQYYSGRCYNFVNINTPTNSLLGFIKRDSRYDDGSGYPSSDKYVRRIVEAAEIYKSAGYYDDFSVQNALQVLYPMWSKSDNIENYDGTIASSLRNAKLTKSKLIVKKSGQQLILAVKAFRSAVIHIRGVRRKKGVYVSSGEIWTLCSYNKKLTWEKH